MKQSLTVSSETSGGHVCFSVDVSTYEDVILARQKVKTLMEEMGFSVLARTRMVTAVSELARNIVLHAGAGVMIVEKAPAAQGRREGILCRFEDQGPGIPDIGMAMKTGYSTANSLGLGLSGARKLCSSFTISSAPGKGTRVVIGEWK